MGRIELLLPDLVIPDEKPAEHNMEKLRYKAVFLKLLVAMLRKGEANDLDDRNEPSPTPRPESTRIAP